MVTTSAAWRASAYQQRLTGGTGRRLEQAVAALAQLASHLAPAPLQISTYRLLKAAALLPALKATAAPAASLL